MIEEAKIYDVIVSDINVNDYPDLCDAYISSARIDNRQLTEEELDSLSSDLIHEYALEELQ